MILNSEKECKIITDLDELSSMSEAIDPRKEGKKVQQIVIDIKRTMRQNNLISLSAPQIGEKYRIFCIKFGKDDYRSFINPLIEKISGFQLAREKCSSIPGKEFIRPRYNSIRFMYQTPLGEYKCNEIKGKSAFVIEHCIDHLDGLTLEDIGLEVDSMFDEATQEERDKVIDLYLQSLDIKKKQLDKEIEENEDLKEINDGLKFVEQVRKGQVILEDAKE